MSVRMSNRSTVINTTDFDKLEKSDGGELVNKCRRLDSKKVKTVIFNFSKFSNHELKRFCELIPVANPK